MFNNKVLLVFAGFSLLNIFTALGESPVQTRVPLSKEEIFANLPRGSDMLDLEETQRYKEFLARGEELYPGLLEIVSESDDMHVIISVLDVFRITEGDKLEVIKAVKDLIPRYMKEGKKEEYILMMTGGCLADIGSSDDASALFVLLNHSSEEVRYNALIDIAKIGDYEALQFLREKYKEMPEGYYKQKLNANLAAMEKRLNIPASQAIFCGEKGPNFHSSLSSSLQSDSPNEVSFSSGAVTSSASKASVLIKLILPLLGIGAVIGLWIFCKGGRK